MAIDYFVPGTMPAGTGLLNGLVPAWPPGVARHFVEANSHSDAIVLDPFAASDILIREAAAAGRRVVATNSNPLVVLLLRQRLSPPDPSTLRAAVTRLGDSLKRGVPLREHLNQLYRTRCPACHRQVVADYYVWSLEPADPRQKWVFCPACGHAGLAAVEDHDLVVLDQIETRGLHYWYLLDRVASPAKSHEDGEARKFVEKLLELYTPRALYAIADILMKIEAIFDLETQTHLKAVLLTCLGLASNLHPPETGHPPDAPHRHALIRATLGRLQPPARFIERNVWRLFEAAIDQRLDAAASMPALPLQADLHWVTRLPPSPEGLIWVHNLSTGAVGRGLSPESVSLVLTIPPQPNPALWSLTYLWAGWLFGPEEAARSKGLALQKWPDWAWYQSAMTTALRAVRPVFRFDGVCVLHLRPSSLQQAFALALAALAAGYDVESWQHCAAAEHQYALVPTTLQAPPAQEPELLRSRVVARSATAATDVVRARDEPVQAETLQIAAWQDLLREGLLEIAQASLPASRVLGWLNAAIGKGLEAAQTTELVPVADDEGRSVGWWLHKADQAGDGPLGDRVEQAVLATLREADGVAAAVEETMCVKAVYRQFSGPLTPEAGLVQACLKAYAEEVSAGQWQLFRSEREEAWPERMSSAILQLIELGERLGYRPRQEVENSGVVWEEEGLPWATFNLAFTAAVARFLPRPDSPRPHPEPRWRNLVIPASRAGLWQYKLETQPWLAPMIRAGGWSFIKLEHLQALTAREDITRHDLTAIVGLVPPVESGEGQLPLF